MAIAIVRIAPLECWCGPEAPKDIVHTRPDKVALLVGQQIEIKTESMMTDPVCNGKAWNMTRASAEKLDALLGGRPGIPKSDDLEFICEHMLEMD